MQHRQPVLTSGIANKLGSNTVSLNEWVYDVVISLDSTACSLRSESFNGASNHERGEANERTTDIYKRQATYYMLQSLHSHRSTSLGTCRCWCKVETLVSSK